MYQYTTWDGIVVCKRDCEDETMKDGRFRNNPLQIIESPNGKIIDFYLYEVIEDISQYVDFLRAVEYAKQDDTVQVHVNCPGGDVDVAWNIYDVLHQTKANVVMSIEGMCASATSMIILAGSEWKVNPHSYVMVHAWSGYRFGKRNEMNAQADFEKRYLETKFREMYRDFMTEEEVELCLEGKDYYFTPEETLQRLQNYQADAIKKQTAIQTTMAKYQDIMNKEIDDILNPVKTTKKTTKRKTTKK